MRINENTGLVRANLMNRSGDHTGNAVWLNRAAIQHFRLQYWSWSHFADFHDHIHKGSILDLKAPMGKFTVDVAKQTPLVLIAGGIGVTPLLSWRVAILPFIGEQNLYNRFRLDQPWDSPHNIALLPLMPALGRSW